MSVTTSLMRWNTVTSTSIKLYGSSFFFKIVSLRPSIIKTCNYRTMHTCHNSNTTPYFAPEYRLTLLCFNMVIFQLSKHVISTFLSLLAVTKYLSKPSQTKVVLGTSLHLILRWSNLLQISCSRPDFRWCWHTLCWKNIPLPPIRNNI